MPETETQQVGQVDGPTDAMLAWLRKEARERVEKQLNALYRLNGSMTREELGAMMDGAQAAVMEWAPPRG